MKTEQKVKRLSLYKTYVSLKEVLNEFDIDEEIKELWINLDLKFKAVIISR